MTRTPLFLLTLAVLTAALPRPVECQRAAPPAGTIAYVRGSKEIRLIASDRTNDRRLWPLPPPELVENAPKFWSVAYADTLMARYPDPDSIPHRAWCYTQGYILRGFEMLADKTGEAKYFNYLKRFVDQHVDDHGNIRGFRPQLNVPRSVTNHFPSTTISTSQSNSRWE